MDDTAIRFLTASTLDALARESVEHGHVEDVVMDAIAKSHQIVCWISDVCSPSKPNAERTVLLQKALTEASRLDTRGIFDKHAVDASSAMIRPLLQLSDLFHASSLKLQALPFGVPFAAELAAYCVSHENILQDGVAELLRIET